MPMYRASWFVTARERDEHSYNLYAHFEEMCCRLGLWADRVHWNARLSGYNRIMNEMNNTLWRDK